MSEKKENEWPEVNIQKTLDALRCFVCGDDQSLEGQVEDMFDRLIESSFVVQDEHGEWVPSPRLTEPSDAELIVWGLRHQQEFDFDLDLLDGEWCLGLDTDDFGRYWWDQSEGIHSKAREYLLEKWREWKASQ